MNIIFLDIDGVLNCELFFNSRIKDAKKVLTHNTCYRIKRYFNKFK